MGWVIDGRVSEPMRSHWLLSSPTSSFLEDIVENYVTYNGDGENGDILLFDDDIIDWIIDRKRE